MFAQSRASVFQWTMAFANIINILGKNAEPKPFSYNKP